MDGVEVFASDKPELCSGLAAFKINGYDTKELSKTLFDEHSIYLREVRHEEINWDVNRMSLHIMATLPQIERTLGLIEEYAASV